MKNTHPTIRTALLFVTCAGMAHAQTPAAVAPAAAAAPTDAPAPALSAADKEARQRYAQSLGKGRKLADGGKLEEARKAFNECLTLAPDEPTALSELGWVEMKLQDFEHAEATTRRAVARAATPSLRAASLFNLGLILRKRNNPAGAIEAFNASLRLRPHPTVLAELRELDPNSAEKLRFAPHTMQGPFSVEDASGKAVRAKVCWQSLAQAWPELEITGPDEKITCKEQRIKADLTGTGMLDVRVWSSNIVENHGKDTMTLAIRTAKGWYTDRFEAYWSNRWAPGTLSVKSIELVTAGDKKLVLVKWHVSVDEWTWGAKNQDYTTAPGREVDNHNAILAGVGASGTPRVTPQLPWKVRGNFSGGKVDAETAMSFPSAGMLKLEGPKETPTKVAKSKYKDLIDGLAVGEFAVEFP